MRDRDLDTEIRTYLSEHGPLTAYEIALGIRARRADVDDALQEGFCRVPRPIGHLPLGTYWGPSPPVPQAQSGTDGRASQCQRVLAVLRDGRPHTASDIHRAAGTMRLNSRVSELRKRGHVIICRHIAGNGPDAYEYLLEVPEDVAA